MIFQFYKNMGCTIELNIGGFQLGERWWRKFFSYLTGDKGYLLLPWIMTPHNEGQQHAMLEFLYNRKHKCEHLIMENVMHPQTPW